jgi:hypothetical protein
VEYSLEQTGQRKATEPQANFAHPQFITWQGIGVDRSRGRLKWRRFRPSWGASR